MVVAESQILSQILIHEIYTAGYENDYYEMSFIPDEVHLRVEGTHCLQLQCTKYVCCLILRPFLISIFSSMKI